MDSFTICKIISESLPSPCLAVHIFNIFVRYRSDSAATNELLANGIGKDLSTELSNPVHRTTLEHITTHLKIGKFAFNDNDEKV